MPSTDFHNSSQCPALLHRAMSAAYDWHCGQRRRVEGLSTSWPMGLLAGHPMCEDQMAVQWHGCRDPVPCLHVQINGSWLTVLHVYAQMMYSDLQQLHAQANDQVRGNYTCHESMDVKLPRYGTCITAPPESPSGTDSRQSASATPVHAR